MEKILKFLLNISPRDYQKEIVKKCIEKNCLVVLPTGIGKTLIALMLAISRMQSHPTEKILFLAPTRPLAQQHFTYFQEHLPELFAQMDLFTGKIEANKRKGLWERADIVFSTPQCIGGETSIFTEDGPIKIKDFFEQFNFKQKNPNKKLYTAEISKKVLGYKNKKISFVNATKAIKLEVDKTLKINTEIGNFLECTPEHPLLTIDSFGNIIWKKAENLRQGDYIASIKEISMEEEEIDIWKLIENSKLKVSNKEDTLNVLHYLKLKNNVLKLPLKDYSRFKYNLIPTKIFFDLTKKLNLPYPKNMEFSDWTGKSKPITLPRYLNRDLSYVIGAMLGDGHLGNRKGHGCEVVFSDLDREEISAEFKKVILNLFGEDMKKDIKKGLVSYNSALSEVFLNLGVPRGRKASRIRVPKFIFFSPIECVAGFIKGIFDTDGNAGKYSVSISSVSKDFITDLKWLFLKIGILGNISKRKNLGSIGKRKIKESIIYTFRFSGRRQLEKFLEICNPDYSKCRKLIESIKNTKRPFTRSKEILPIKGLLNKVYLNNQGKFARYLISYLSGENLQKISLLSKGKEAEKLKELLSNSIRWTKIKKIEESKEKMIVYDFTIEKEHNFITNYIISHNCIANDVKEKLYNLSQVSLLIEDEAHRCVKNYSYTYVAKKYLEQKENNKENTRILGLTASPGTNKEAIKTICKNLSIEEVEIRTRESEDVKEYLQELEIKVIKLEFPKEFAEIRNLLKKIYDKKTEELKSRHLLFGPINKVTLLEAQGKIMRSLATGNKNFNLFAGASAAAQALKVQHALELIETQTLYALDNYFQTLFEQARKEQSKAVKNLVANAEFNNAYIQTKNLISQNLEHPKLLQLKDLIENKVAENPKAKIIVFSQYRDSVTKICRELNSLNNVTAKVFVGQAKKTLSNKPDNKENTTGLSQKEQQQIIQEFSRGEFNVLCATSIAEEGLDIPEVNAVIFYEPVPSAIRKIQRAGRTARLMPGEVIMLVTKATRDESYYWAAHHKEKSMHKAISAIKQDLENEKLNFTINENEETEQKKLF
ncbi:DEAD/DEAH box helicase [Candidatus Pacearchaeota archaeon]|nr:DEAD/DEAH box helicase [Candidatus Pacearchaeota archaeon]